MKKIGILLLIWSCSAVASTQSEIEDLKKRIESLEKQQEELLLSTDAPKNSVGSFLNDELTLGGFFDGGYDFITGPDTDSQGTNSSNSLGINLSANFGNNYRFVSQLVNILEVPLLNEHNDPAAPATGLPDEREYRTYTTLSVLTQGYIEYTVNRKFIIQGGLGYVPFGYVLQLREPVLYVRSQGPQLAKNRELISPLWSGLHIHGSVQKGERAYGYNIYTYTPTDYAKYMGLGGRVWASVYDDKVIGGISSQVGRDQNEMVETIGADLRFDFHPFQLRTEFAQDIAKEGDTWTAYVEPGYFVFEEEILLYVFGDYYYGSNHKTGLGSITVADPFQKYEYGFGVNWLPTSYTRIRTGFTFHDYVGNRARPQGQNRDYTSLNISAGVAF